jgi:hypothetical protein
MRRLLWLALLLPRLATAQTTVQVSPSDSIQSGCTFDTSGQSCTLPMRGKTTAALVVTAISSPTGWVMTPYVSMDGTNYNTTTFFEDPATLARTATLVNADLTVGKTRSIVLAGGTRFVRVLTSGTISGTVTIALTGTDTIDQTTTVVQEVKADGAYTAHTAGTYDTLHIDTQGRLMVRDDHWNPFVCRTNDQTTMVNSTCTPSLPGGSGVYHYVTGVVLSNGPTAQTMKVLASTTTACGGSPTDVTSTVYLGVNSGASLTFPQPIKIGQANSYLCCQGSGNTAASCTITGFLAP